MATIIYLDVDDEITSAASRIRAAEPGRVGLVLPYGSRLATSRINFRLLAREAQARGRRLWIVAPEPATRALAASAGLPAFATVNEYEASLVAPEDGGAAGEGTGVAPAASAIVPAAIVAAAEPGGAPLPSGSDRAPVPEERTETVEVPPAMGSPAAPVRTVSSTRLPPAVPVAAPARRLRIGGHDARPGAIIAVVAIAAVLALVGGVAGYVLLPSASITLTPLVQAVGPVEFTVTAQPAVTQPDPATLTVPAVKPTFKLSAIDTFPATGKKVTETAATGTVRFTSTNTFLAVPVPAGTIVATSTGIQFATTKAVTVPTADFVSQTYGVADAPVQAVATGLSGNVAANTITREPSSLSASQVTVNNPNPTSGGTHVESPQVAQADVNAALKKLTAALSAQLDAAVASGAGLPAGTTVFPTTKSMTAPTTSVDPKTLVGTDAATFQLGLSATGSVLAADPGPVTTVAESRISSAVDAGYALVGGSIQVVVGTPVVAADTVTFPVTARASEIRVVDRSALLRGIKGRPIAEARSFLDAYGAVAISVWPAWVTSIPTIDSRLTFIIATPTGSAPSSSAPPSPPASPASSGGPPP